MSKAPSKQPPTAQERALADVADSTWNDYIARFRPAEAALIKKAEFTAGEKAQVQGEASADAASAFKGLSRDTVAKAGQAGANVGSGKTKFGLAADAEAAGGAVGLGKAAAVTGGELDSEQQKLRIAGFGRKVAAGTMANLSRGAQRATSLALAASQAKFDRNNAIVEGISAVAGAATRKYQLAQEKKQVGDKGSDNLVDMPPPSYSTSQPVDPFDFKMPPGMVS